MPYLGLGVPFRPDDTKRRREGNEQSAGLMGREASARKQARLPLVVPKQASRGTGAETLARRALRERVVILQACDFCDALWLAARCQATTYGRVRRAAAGGAGRAPGSASSSAARPGGCPAPVRAASAAARARRRAGTRGCAAKRDPAAARSRHVDTTSLGRDGARCRRCRRSVSPSRSPNRTSTFPRIRLSTGHAIADRDAGFVRRRFPVDW